MATRGWENVVAEQLAGLPAVVKPKPPSKYRNVKVTVEGITFDSKREAQQWHELRLRERAGDIRDLRRQVVFALQAPVRDMPPGTTVIVATYIADFMYLDAAGQRHVVDAKGTRTQIYSLKKKWLELQDQIVIEEV